jgi:hypothetical protein
VNDLTPDSCLDLSSAVLGADIVRILGRRTGSVLVEAVLTDFLKGDARRTHTMFFDALTVLYCLGFVRLDDYRVELVAHDPPRETLF